MENVHVEPKTITEDYHDAFDWDQDDPPPIKWCIDKLMDEGENLLVSGPTGVGKSLFRTQLALAIVADYEFMGYQAHYAPILIIQHENSINAEWRRYKRMVQDFRLPGPGRLLYWEGIFDLPNKKSFNELRNIVERSGAKIVIYDCLATLHNVNENDNAQMRAVCECLKKIDRACNNSSIIIHHHRKPSKESEGDELYNIRGASAITDYAGNIVTLSRSEGYFKVKVEKTRNSEEAGKEFVCSRNPQTLALEVLAEEDYKTVYDAERIKSVLQDGPIITQKAFCDALVEAEIANSPKTARRMIDWAASHRHVFKFGARNRRIYSVDTEYATACKQMEI